MGRNLLVGFLDAYCNMQAGGLLLAGKTKDEPAPGPLSSHDGGVTEASWGKYGFYIMNLFPGRFISIYNVVYILPSF
ncbi:hypothetical protein CJF30_00009455 [Rutstroemia sp. NJR-2017a BBW]|nr:hypothetical protein CJF30_00009455 [Rutstroemia sp. NJR-2017a BBW]